MKASGDTIIVGNFEVAMQLTQQRTIKVSGYIYADETNEAVNARLDAAQDALDRQYVRADIITKEAMIEAKTAGLLHAREHFAALVEKKNARDRGEKVRLTTQDAQSIDRYDQDVKNANIEIEALRAAIAKGKQKINGHLQA